MLDRDALMKTPGGQAAICRRYVTGESVASIAKSFKYKTPICIYDAIRSLQISVLDDPNADFMEHYRVSRETAGAALDKWCRT